MDPKLFFKQRLMTPGPSPVPDFVFSAMNDGLKYHRSPEIADTISQCRSLLQKVFRTKEDVLMLTGSGTLAMEASICTFFQKGDKVLAVNSGKFGQRWHDQANIYGLEVDEVYVERGHAVDVKTIEDKIKANPDYRGILIHASETSASVRHDLKSISKLGHSLKDCLVVVDSVTATGVVSVPMDEWGLDIVVSGSQKGFMLPPGLSLLAASQRAWARAESIENPVAYYMDVKKEKKAQAAGSTAFTGATSMFAGLLRVLKYVDAIGLEEYYKARWKMVYAVRAALKSMGLKLLVESDDECSPSCTAVFTEGLIANKDLKTKFGLTMAGGQDELKGKIIRIAHLGYMDAWDVQKQFCAVGLAMKEAGKEIDLGKALDVYFHELSSDEDKTPENWS